MPQYDYKKHLEEVARLMELAGRTAPKSRGEDFVEIMVLSDEQVAKLADAMVEFGEKRKLKDFDRDGDNTRKSPVVLLIGLRKATTVSLDCGACGFNTCKELEAAAKSESDFLGPICALRHLDFGIALGSAVKTAQMMNVDNRIMYRIGVVARDMGLVDWDFVMGIPLSASGKSIYFDREKKK